MIEGTLGEYLRARRAAVAPGDAGLPDDGRRRVPGLRREEVATLAGVSTDYYVRLEQGRADQPSDQVLGALARALRLGSAERAHLFDLARQGAATRRPAARAEAFRASLERAVASVTDVPALVMNQRSDVLAWNSLACALIADFPALDPRERNMARLIFLDSAAREIHPDWPRAARDTVGILRMAAGQEPHDRRLVELVGELSLGSDAFRKLWSSHHVHEKSHGRKHFRHPEAGELVLDYESFAVPGQTGLMLVIYTAAVGGDAERALSRLSPR